MKIHHLFMALSLVLFSYLNSAAQDQKMKAVEFKVTGNCEMCKKTIESSLKGQPGIQSSNWNKNTKMIKVVYDPAKTTEDKIHQAIADSGYDTEKVKASDKSYKALPGCCKYDRTIHTKKGNN